ncbi:hypothetical protein N9Z54_06465 [Planctomycetota bacterium]|nr:hypothetical protein [Planctomycetota bacterium]
MPDKSLSLFLSMAAAGVAGAVGASLLPSDAPPPQAGLTALQSAQLNAGLNDLSNGLELLNARLTSVEDAASLVKITPRSQADGPLTRAEVEAIVAEFLASSPSSAAGPAPEGLESALDRMLDARAERARLAAEQESNAIMHEALEGQIGSLRQNLGLSDEQVLAVREIFQEQTSIYVDRQRELESSGSYGPEEHLELWFETRAKTKAAMKESLTPIQFDEYSRSLEAQDDDPGR